MVNDNQEYRRYRKYYRNLRVFYKKPPVRDFTFLVLSLLTVSFFSFFAIKPSVETIGELMKKIKDERTATERLEQKINALSIAQKEYNLIRPELATIYGVLPKKSDFSKLAKQIEYLSQKNNSTLLNLRINKASLFGEDNQELIPLKLDITIDGGYKNLKNLLVDLENLNRVVTMENVTISKKRTDEVEIGLSLKLSAQAYYLP